VWRCTDANGVWPGFIQQLAVIFKRGCSKLAGPFLGSREMDIRDTHDFAHIGQCGIRLQMCASNTPCSDNSYSNS
jgi:hypothetical protein